MPLLPAAIAIVLDETRNNVLLVKRCDVPVWVLPGGGVDPGETPEEAVVREVLEETGFQVSIERQCAEYTPINRLAAFTSLFICRIESGEVALSDESAEVAFFPLKSLPQDLFIIHKDWLAEGLSQNMVIRKPMTNVTYWALFKFLVTNPKQVIRFAWSRFSSK